MEPLTFSAREAFYKKVFHVMEYSDEFPLSLSLHPFRMDRQEGLLFEAKSPLLIWRELVP